MQVLTLGIDGLGTCGGRIFVGWLAIGAETVVAVNCWIGAGL